MALISIAGSARRSYTFPAPLDAAFRFNADLDRMLPLLPHITVIDAPSPSTRRLCYEATESGLYRVQIHCTVSTEIDERARRIRIRPEENPAREHAGFRTMSGRGSYDSTIRFHANADATRIEYELKLRAALPVATSLSLIPTVLLDRSAGRIFSARLDEILDGFVERSIAAYRRESVTPRPDSVTTRARRDRRA
jgi:hypothetical protein